MSENKREGVRKVPRKRREIIKLVERERSRKEREREMLNETYTREKIKTNVAENCLRGK